MSVRTICFTGMDRDEESTLKALFATANAELGDNFALAAEAQADVVIVDMDTIYGHMSWLKAHGRGQVVVALSGRTHTETDHNLLRPVDLAALTSLLRSLLTSTHQAEATGDDAPSHGPDATEATDTPVQPVDVTHQGHPEDLNEPVYAGQEAVGPTIPETATSAVEKAEASPADAVTERRLLDYLFPGALSGAARLALAGHPAIAVDPATQRYYGPATLKPLLPLARQSLSDSDWAPLSSAELSESGEAHPLSRLVWLSALAAGEGALLGDHGPGSRFKLAKWPQTEREFPKHFRIATAMMKAPATVAEIAQSSGASEAEVADFINANLATGFAEPEPTSQAAGKDGRLGFLSPRRP